MGKFEVGKAFLHIVYKEKNPKSKKLAKSNTLKKYLIF